MLDSADRDRESPCGAAVRLVFLFVFSIASIAPVVRRQTTTFKREFENRPITYNVFSNAFRKY
jgi:hypothetical protein